MQYHYHLQGFIYSLLEGSRYHYLHNKEGYKFFCFSNIFPAKDLEIGDLRTLMVSSPDNEFLSYVYDVLQKWNAKVKIKYMKFGIEYVQKLNVNIPTCPFTLITGTPITIRIPREKYKAHGVEPRGYYDYVYWRSDHPISLFISQIENNLVRKYSEYFEFNNDRSLIEDNNNFPHLLQQYKFKKQISTRVYMKGLDQIIIATLWEFEFNTFPNKDMIQV
jgi:CRISPR-associated endoribonuclease Cas6